MSSVTSVDGGYSYYQKPLDDLEQEYKDETRKARERYEERSDRLEKRTSEALEKENQRSQEATDEIRNQSAERVAQDRAAAREMVEKDRARTYDKFGRSQAEVLASKKEAEAQVQSAIDGANQRVKDSGENKNWALDKQAGEYEDRLHENAFKDRMSREKETSQLREVIHTLSNNQDQYLKEKGQGTTDAYHDLETEMNARYETAARQHSREMENYQEKSAATDRHNAALMDATQKERDAYYTGMISKREQEHQQDRTQMQRGQNQMRKDQENMLRKQVAADSANLEAYAEKADVSKSEALEKQNEVYKNEIHQTRVENNDKIKTLEQELLTQRTSADDTYISPAAEQKFRESVMKNYDKTLAAEQNRNKEKTTAIQEGYAKKLTEANNEGQKKLYDAVSQRQVEEHLERQAYLASLDDLQKGHETAIKSKDYEKERHVDHISKNYESTMDRQRRELEEQYNDARNQTQLKMADLRQQHLFESRMAQKDFATRQSEIVRGYEKKLEEQKSESDYQIANMKEELARNHSESERRNKQMLEEQSKGYEQKISQLEYQSKERERTISENYQDQIDKLKRSNALIIQRRSEKS